jgi:hypothetical protein
LEPLEEFVVCQAKESRSIYSVKPLLPLIASAVLLVSCAPQREFVSFDPGGNFHTARQSSNVFRDSTGEYDSYEVIDHGAPNHGYPPMYAGGRQYSGYATAYTPQCDGGYPKVVKTYDQIGNPSSVIIPNPW